MPLKYTLLFQLNTAPTNLARASAHIGGWSETIWDVSAVADIPKLGRLATRRALLLPATAKIVGYRTQAYTIVGNQLVPGGSATGAFNLPGTPGLITDLPQVAVLLKAQARATPNTRKFTLRGVPDEVMVGGEYQPGFAFNIAMGLYQTQLVQDAWYFPARDLTQASVRILGITARVLTTDNPIAGAVVGDFVRLLKVRDKNRNAVKGTFAIEAIAGNNYTLRNFDTTVLVGASGRVRKDAISILLIGGTEISRAVVKKVGRPFEQYRGRRSKAS